MPNGPNRVLLFVLLFKKNRNLRARADDITHRPCGSHTIAALQLKFDRRVQIRSVTRRRLQNLILHEALSFSPLWFTDDDLRGGVSEIIR
jgi:hypothetical protein